MEQGLINIEVSTTMISFAICEAQKDRLENFLKNSDLEFLHLRRTDRNVEDEDQSTWRITYSMRSSYNFRDMLDNLQSQNWVKEVNWKTTRL